MVTSSRGSFGIEPGDPRTRLSVRAGLVPRAGLAPHTGLSRRGFLVGALAVAGTSVLASCSTAPAVAPSGAASPGSAPAPSATPGLAASSFAIAHRGSGDDWTEHTLTAYTSAIAAGATIVEISVCATSDGVLVCHHDTDLQRMSGRPGEIADLTWADLAGYQNDAREWLGPNTPLEPIPRLADVLAALDPGVTLYVEDKQGTNTTPLLDLMDRSGGPARFVWKQWAGASQWSAAADRGYRRWGYFDDATFDRLDQLAPNFDMLGVPTATDDAQIAALVAVGKPVIAWEVHRRSERDRLTSLGVTGLMASNFPYVTTAGASARADTFASGRRAAGDLPYSTVGWDQQPAFLVDDAAVRLSGAQPASYLMGSLAPVGSASYRVTADARWPESLPSSDQHLGLAIGQDTDAPYRIGTASTTGGYHVVSRANGTLELFRRDAGADSGTSIAHASGSGAATGQWYTLTVDVSPTRIRATRSDGATVTADVSAAPGPYVSLLRGYGDGPDVDFRHVTVTPA